MRGKSFSKVEGWFRIRIENKQKHECCNKITAQCLLMFVAEWVEGFYLD